MTTNRAIQISVEDVKNAAYLMGKDFSDPERLAVIQCMETCDVQACPGSGKTTAVVAKLVILAEKLRGSNHGICVLSHTNAAREEIENSLGAYTPVLFKYPNFIGTIQSFTDLFLAIPAYIEQYCERPSIINDEVYESIASRYYYRLEYGTKQFLDRKKQGYGKEYFANLSYRFKALDQIAYYDSREEQDFPAGLNTPSYQNVLQLKKEITQLGYLTYHDAFAFAYWYIQRYPHLTQVLSKRYPYVFIDEMQDTDQYQLSLLNILFARSIVQKYGDSNQAIYGHRSECYQPVWVPQPGYQISTSKRLSQSIARLSRDLRVNPQQVDGNPSYPDLDHTVIVFEPETIQKVIPFFGKMIEQQKISKGCFMALGAVGKLNSLDPNKLSISSYWPDFDRYQTQTRSSNSFWDNIGLAQKGIKKEGNLGIAKDYLLEGIVKLLQSQNTPSSTGKTYSTQVFMKDIRKTGEHNSHLLQFILLNWCKALYANGKIDSQIILNDIRYLFGLLNIQATPQTIQEIRNVPTVLQQPENLKYQQVMNRYHYSDDIEITINTIHSAKGQTHTATLLLETFFHQFDLEKVIPYLIGKPPKKPGIRIQQRFLPLSYVACTRPTHLLCLAIRRDHISPVIHQQLEQVGWTVTIL